MTQNNHTHQTALVTGASRGIGASIALTLAQQGFHVTGTATTPEGAARISEQLSAFAGCQGACLQVNDAEQVQAAFVGKPYAAVISTLGTTRGDQKNRPDYIGNRPRRVAVLAGGRSRRVWARVRWW